MRNPQRKTDNLALPQLQKKSALFYFKRDWQLYFLVAFPILFVVVFKYAAYPGIRMAFMDYKPAKGYAGSEWVGFEIFVKIFKDKDFLIALRNSIIFNLLDLLAGFPAPIILALLFNEIKISWFKRASQTILYLPHFLSWVVIASVMLNLMKPETGLINIFLTQNGFIESGIPFLTEKYHWAVSYILIGVWQSMGWGSIIYLSSMLGIAPELYEAAMIDGANKLQRIWHITLPGIRPTIVTLLIMNLGRVMGSNFERLVAFGNVQVTDFQYQLAIYIYEKGLGAGNFSKATAVGLFQALVGLILVLIADKVAKSIGENGLI